jgi:capsular polysaccharide biosynthesis protein
MLIGTVPSPSSSLAPPRQVNQEALSPAIAKEQRRRWAQERVPACSVEVHRHEDCWLGPRGAVLTASGEPLPGRSALAGEELQAARDHLAALADPPRIAGEAILLGGVGHSAYGHWLIELLPALRVAARFVDVERRKVLIPRVHNQLLGTYLEALSRLGAAGVETFRNLWFRCDALVTERNLAAIESFLSPLVTETYAALGAGVDPAGARRVFVSRQGTRSRRIVDFDEIEPVLRDRGFELIELEGMPLAEQISWFKGAETIVGPMGSGLSGMCFAPRGASVLALAPTAMLDSFFWRLANVCGHPYRELRCPVGPTLERTPSWDRDLRVEPGTLATWLDDVGAD